MQNPGRRTTRQELKEDELVTSAMKVWVYTQENFTKVLAGVGAVAILVLLGVFLYNDSLRKAQAAIEALGKVQVHVLNSENGEAILAAERIVEDYPKDPAADQALLALGNLYFDLGRTEEARAAFQKRIDRFGLEGPGGYAAWSGVATVIEQLGTPGQAGDNYLTYVDQQPDSPFIPMALSEAGRCYRIAGNMTKAAESYRRIVRDYPGTPSRQLAESELNLMGEKPWTQR